MDVKVIFSLNENLVFFAMQPSFYFSHYLLSGVRGAAATASLDLVKENEEVDGARGTKAVIHYSKAAPATSSMGVASENGGSSHFVRVSVQ